MPRTPLPLLGLLLAAALLTPGCGRGGGDLDHPRTLDAMVRDARAPGREAAPTAASGRPDQGRCKASASAGAASSAAPACSPSA